MVSDRLSGSKRTNTTNKFQHYIQLHTHTLDACLVQKLLKLDSCRLSLKAERSCFNATSGVPLTDCVTCVALDVPEMFTVSIISSVVCCEQV